MFLLKNTYEQAFISIALHSSKMPVRVGTVSFASVANKAMDPIGILCCTHLTIAVRPFHV